MYLIFYKTNDVFFAEEKLTANEISVEIVPTPVQDKAYCGVCVKINQSDERAAANIIGELEYKTVD